jgi:hypothetical protein
MLHSTRHNWGSALTSAGVLRYIIDALGGWADRSMSTGRYGSNLSAEARREAVERLDFSDALRDLSALEEQQIRYASASSSALASFRSAVSKPSVNQP